MTSDEADDCYGSVNIAENDSSRLAGVKLSTVIITASPPEVIWEERVATPKIENALVCYMC